VRLTVTCSSTLMYNSCTLTACSSHTFTKWCVNTGPNSPKIYSLFLRNHMFIRFCLKIHKCTHDDHVVYFCFFYLQNYLTDYDTTKTCYELDGPGIESQWRRDFPHPSRPALGPFQPPTQWVPGPCLADKAAGAWL
jgi:hypothetical protein